MIHTTIAHCRVTAKLAKAGELKCLLSLHVDHKNTVDMVSLLMDPEHVPIDRHNRQIRRTGRQLYHKRGR